MYEEEIVVVVDVTVEEEKAPVEEEITKHEWPETGALGTIVVTNTGLPPTSSKVT